MVMTNVPASDRSESNVVQCIRKRFTFASNGVSQTIGKLPPGAVVLASSGVQVVTAFNDSGTDTLIIGTSADDDEYATLLDITAVGFKPADELATHDGYSDTAEVTVTAKYVGQNSNATTGVGDVVITYSTKTVT